MKKAESQHVEASSMILTCPAPKETMQSMGTSGHNSRASLMATTAGLLATMAPSCSKQEGNKKTC